MVELSQSVVTAIDKIFRELDRSTVSQMLAYEMADNLPFMSGISDLARFDRLRMAVLKLSNGHVDALYKGIDLAKRDWRDLLTTVGFGQLDAHFKWYQSLLGSRAEEK